MSFKVKLGKKTKYSTAGYENPKSLCERKKGSVHEPPAVPPTLGSEVRKKTPNTKYLENK